MLVAAAQVRPAEGLPTPERPDSCPTCGEPWLDATTNAAWPDQCPHCHVVFCTVCHQDGFDPCPHYITYWDDNDFQGVPALLQCLDIDVPPDVAEWDGVLTQDDTEALPDGLRRLLVDENERLFWCAHSPGTVDDTLGWIDAPVVKIGWLVDGFAMSSSGAYYFSPDREAVRRQVTALSAALHQELRRLPRVVGR